MEIITWLYNNILGIENEIKKCLGIYSLSTEVGRWLQSIIGIGPVLSAAMISFFDIDRAPSVSHFYSYSGLNDNNDPWLGKDRAKELVDKYTKVHKHGYTQYETDMAIKKRLEEMREEGKEIPEVPSLKKPDSAEAIQKLHQTGVRKTVMLTGDSEEIGRAVSSSLGIDQAYAGLLPGNKVEKVEELLKEKSKKGILAFVGDGINDAPVLSRADIGIAMGAMGSDAAIEASDIVLMDDKPSKIATAIQIARRTIGIAHANIIFALAVKAAILILGAFGIANMWAAVFADVGVSVIAILNSMRALRIKKFQSEQ